MKELQTKLAEMKLDGWLLYDYKRSNPFFHLFLKTPSNKTFTRRVIYWVPQTGEPVKLVSAVEEHLLDDIPGKKIIYRNWSEWQEAIRTLLSGKKTIALEYSPLGAIPAISRVDAGTVDLIRKCGVEVASSENLLQYYTSILSEEQAESHFRAAQHLENIAEETWKFITSSVQNKKQINEYHVQQFMLERMAHYQMETDHPPICATNEHSADPHYDTNEKSAKVIKLGDWVLLDLWAKEKGEQTIYADITRVGVLAEAPSELQSKIFTIVDKARMAAIAAVEGRFSSGKVMQGWEIDEICRREIALTGYEDTFIHRTGHNIGQEVHGLGANLDNFESHDTRFLITGLCFSIEPGIYLKGSFGVRLECDMYLSPQGKAIVTGGLQRAIWLLRV